MLRQVARRFSTSAIRRAHIDGGVPGENLPFDIKNRYKLTLIMGFYLGSGFATPFLIVRHHLTK